MFETTIKWHKTSEELPEKSCMVLIITELQYVHHLKYSYENKTFYASDSDDDIGYALNNAIYWAYADEFKSQLKEKTADCSE